MGRLEGKTALITGGASGQGAAEAARFSAEGAAVIVADIADGSPVVDSLPGEGAFLTLDVSEPDAWREAVDAVQSRFGRLDVLVNNAGIAPGGGVRPFDEIELEHHHRLFDVHVHGVFYGMRAALPLLRQSSAASIVNISSIDGLAGVWGMTSYVGTKFAVTGITRSAAIELGPLGIRVNSIHPGVIESPMVTEAPEEIRQKLDRLFDRQPIKRAGTPEEVANMALFLASDESSYCTGAQFTVDGGHLAGPYRETGT